MPGEASHLVAETAARILADFADPQTVNRDTDGSWKTRLWNALNAAGLTLAWVPETLGGSGASIADGFAILGAAGRVGLSGAACGNIGGRLAASARRYRGARDVNDRCPLPAARAHHYRRRR